MMRNCLETKAQAMVTRERVTTPAVIKRLVCLMSMSVALPWAAV
jgi:hypothetical protein